MVVVTVLSNLCYILSNVLWLVVFIPQLIENYTNKSSDAISFNLILMWILGDLFAIIATLYKNVSVALLVIAVYRFVIDIVLTTQIVYYRLKYTNVETEFLLEEISTQTETSPFRFSNKTLFKKLFKYEIVSLVTVVLSTMLLYFTLPLSLLGDFFAWGATMIFMTSRIPQIVLNRRRKSVVGLSFNTFKMIIVSNSLYITGLLLPLYDFGWEYFFNNLQWIIGSMSGLFFDFVIICQFNKLF